MAGKSCKKEKKKEKGYKQPKGATSRNVKNKNTFWLVQTCRGCARSGTRLHRDPIAVSMVYQNTEIRSALLM